MRKSKVIHTLEYEKFGHHLKIPLRLVADQTFKGQAPTFIYAAKIEEPFKAEATGLTADAVAKELFAKLDVLLSVVWKPHLLVTVHIRDVDCNRDGSNTTGRELSIEVDYIAVGTRFDGSIIHVGYDGAKGPRDPKQSEIYNIHKGLPTTHALERATFAHSDRDQESTSLVEDTPTNRAALQSTLDALSKLAAGVGELFSPTKIQQTLIEAAHGLRLSYEKKA